MKEIDNPTTHIEVQNMRNESRAFNNMTKVLPSVLFICVNVKVMTLSNII